MLDDLRKIKFGLLFDKTSLKLCDMPSMVEFGDLAMDACEFFDKSL